MSDEVKQFVFSSFRSSAGGWVAYEVEGIHWDGPGGGKVQVVTQARGDTPYGAIAALCERLEHEQRLANVRAPTKEED